jgi:hypothetical protein
MALKYTNISHIMPSKICPNLDFWFEKKPSGNPARQLIAFRQKPLEDENNMIAVDRNGSSNFCSNTRCPTRYVKTTTSTKY